MTWIYEKINAKNNTEQKSNETKPRGILRKDGWMKEDDGSQELDRKWWK